MVFYLSLCPFQVLPPRSSPAPVLLCASPPLPPPPCHLEVTCRCSVTVFVNAVDRCQAEQRVIWVGALRGSCGSISLGVGWRARQAVGLSGLSRWEMGMLLTRGSARRLEERERT